MQYSKFVVAAVTFVAVAVALTLLNGTGSDPAPAGAATKRSTDTRIRALQKLVRAEPDDPRGYAGLADAYLQKGRETELPVWQDRAERQLQRALELDPRSPDALVGLATLQLARHDFAAGLKSALAARRAQPGTVRPYAGIVDGLVELGRYEDARRELQRMVDLRPDIASYSRVSYLRELHGDLEGAGRAMALAVAAGGEAPENVAYVQKLLGHLEFQRGRLDEARRAYLLADRSFPGFPEAQLGLAKVEAAQGNLEASLERWRRLVARLPDADHLIGLGEVEMALGMKRAARRHFKQALQKAQPTSAEANPEPELVLITADHGSPRRAVAIGRQVLKATPTIRAEHALGWALTKAGRPEEGLKYARRSLRTGWRDPVARCHAAVTARAAGEPQLARRWLASGSGSSACRAQAARTPRSPYASPAPRR